MKRSVITTIVYHFVAMAGSLVFAWTANAALIDQPMTGATAPGWVLGGTPASASLTGTGAIDPVGDGWLRLTNSSTDQAGYAYYNTPISLSQGALIQFDYMTWGGNGADGYTVFLFDASVPTFSIGAPGGSLGYAMKTGINGISGGYVGIGVDEFGNFATNADGRTSGGTTLRPNTVTVRGPISSAAPPTGGMQGTQSYRWIATSANNGALWANQGTRPAPTSAEYRRVQMRISPAPNPVVDVWIQFGFNTPLIQMISGATIGAAPPASLKLGYAASTGGSTNYHEIRNLVVEPSGYSNSINLGVTKTASVASITVGSPITYTVIVRNFGPNNITANGVGIVDTVPAQISGVTWSCAATGGAACGAASGSGNNLNTTANLPFNGAVTYTISGTLTSYPGANLVNTATLTVPAGVTDYRSSDNSATTTTPVVTSFDFGITKTSPNTSYLIGQPISYSVTAQNNGPASNTAYNVGIADTIPTQLTGVTWTCTAAGGATCVAASGSGNSLITSAHLPLNGTATYSISGTLSSLPSGGTLGNTASLVIPAGYTDTNVANNSATAAIPAAGSTPGTGNKPLYLYGATGYQLSRIPTPGTPGYITIAEGNSRTWTLSQPLAASVTLDPAISSTVPVNLYMASNQARTITATVSLACSAGGATLTQQLSEALDTTPELFNPSFNLPLGASLTCPAGATWELTIRNNTSGTGTRDLRVYPVNGTNLSPTIPNGQISQVLLPSQNVININNNDIAFYGATYSGGTALASVNAGQTVYIRATVSDPFGSFDISGATITLRDSTGTVRLAPAAMTQVQDSGAATRIYEYAYTVPSTGPAGNWSALVVAREGTEGTVSDNAQAVIPVVSLPLLTVTKTTSPVISSTNPGQPVTYTSVITNSGTGAATTVELTDILSPYTAWGVNSFGAGVAFQFVDGPGYGAAASGLTLGAAVYSNDKGVSWSYTPSSTAGGAPAGYDANVTNWKIPMTGTMNGWTGSPNPKPSFTINYKVLVR